MVLEHHVAFELVEEFLPRVDVVVLAGVRAAHHHDDEIAHRETHACCPPAAFNCARLASIHCRKLKRLQGIPCVLRAFRGMLRAARLKRGRSAMRSGAPEEASAGARQPAAFAGAVGGRLRPPARPCTGPWHHQRPAPAARARARNSTSSAAAGRPELLGRSTGKRNTLVLDLTAAQRFGQHHPEAGPKALPGRWRLAFRVTPGDDRGSLEVQADQRSLPAHHARRPASRSTWSSRRACTPPELSR